MGNIREIWWRESTEEHVARHGISREEVEEVCFGPHWMLRSRRRRKAAFGQTAAGRYLLVVLEMLDYAEYEVVTARDMTLVERRRYRAWRGVR